MTTRDSKLGYAPRNALNADALKAAIAARSRTRGDNDAVRSWLLNHFYRHVVANFEPARPIESIDDARDALGGTSIPAWVQARFAVPRTAAHDAPAPVVWVDPAAPQLLVLEARLVEFLESRTGTSLDGKLDRINCPQALALWEKEHARIAARLERGWRESQPDALVELLNTPSGRFVEFRHDCALLRAEMAFETYVMRHCLGQFADRQALTGGYGERYAEAIEAKRLRLVSFRDKQGQPHITISLIVRAGGKPKVEQVKGKQNRPPIARYIDDLLACLNALDTNDATPPDCIAIGIVRTESGWGRIENVRDAASQAKLIGRYPQLFPRLAAPAPVVEWLVAARQPELLRGPNGARTPSVRYAVRDKVSGSEAAFCTEGVKWPGLDVAEAQALQAARTLP
ncbi:hypothetical protein C0Z18_29655 [Trinickia dabaoshanensis]|uniref:Cytoplasmic protein n=1 Tax=Trinickia dabaoshanensis TaxID=564714 RepID=A0A2N7VCQ8_9BURK|nr:hypothetical protein [Trinickia dabaoshanensis]PMS14936.1 hypothetical protein C0Z18_29655 [Trinickia dabaoshanensis]